MFVIFEVLGSRPVAEHLTLSGRLAFTPLAIRVGVG
jgi:hypothetical protein